MEKEVKKKKEKMNEEDEKEEKERRERMAGDVRRRGGVLVEVTKWNSLSSFRRFSCGCPSRCMSLAVTCCSTPSPPLREKYFETGEGG